MDSKESPRSEPTATAAREFTTLCFPGTARETAPSASP